jgi:hypothetical protein
MRMRSTKHMASADLTAFVDRWAEKSPLNCCLCSRQLNGVFGSKSPSRTGHGNDLFQYKVSVPQSFANDWVGSHLLLEKRNISRTCRTCFRQLPALQRLRNPPGLLGSATSKTGRVEMWRGRYSHQNGEHIRAAMNKLDRRYRHLNCAGLTHAKLPHDQRCSVTGESAFAEYTEGDATCHVRVGLVISAAGVHCARNGQPESVLGLFGKQFEKADG